MRSSQIMPVLFLASTLACAALSGTAERKARAGQHDTAQSSHANEQETAEGQQVFQQNCSRCHNAPESFPASITGTIVRHMRVRANLSRHDERVLLKFLNP